MSWQLLLGISLVSYSFTALLQRVIIKHEDSDPVAFASVYQILTGIIIAVYAFIYGFHMPNLLAFIPNILLMIVLYAAMNILTFKSLKLIAASELTSPEEFVIFVSLILDDISIFTLHLFKKTLRQIK